MSNVEKLKRKAKIKSVSISTGLSKFPSMGVLVFTDLGIDEFESQVRKEERERIKKSIQKSKDYYESIERYDYSAGFDKAILLSSEHSNALKAITPTTEDSDEKQNT